MGQLTAEAAVQGADLVLCPEALIPGYPRGLGFGTVVGSRSPEGRCTWQRYWVNAVEVPGPATEALGKVARQNGVYLAVGVIERDTQFSGGTLYCTLLYFGADGQLLGKHRKLKPTAAERLIWDEGDGEEGILYADLDLAEVARGNFDFDVVGHYAQPDVFQLMVNEEPRPPVVNKFNIDCS